jgi:signal transduction histidine kinase
MLEPFETGNSAKDSAGLGLSIVQEIMAAHGGKLIMTSGPGAGTSACLRFPEAAFAARNEASSFGTEGT